MIVYLKIYENHHTYPKFTEEFNTVNEKNHNKDRINTSIPIVFTCARKKL